MPGIIYVLKSEFYIEEMIILFFTQPTMNSFVYYVLCINLLVKIDFISKKVKFQTV